MFYHVGVTDPLVVSDKHLRGKNENNSRDKRLSSLTSNYVCPLVPQCQGSWFGRCFCLWRWLRRASFPTSAPSYPMNSRTVRWSSCCNPVGGIGWIGKTLCPGVLFIYLSDRVRPGKDQLRCDVETHQTDFKAWTFGLFLSSLLRDALCRVWETFTQQSRTTGDPPFGPVIVTKDR